MHFFVTLKIVKKSICRMNLRRKKPKAVIKVKKIKRITKTVTVIEVKKYNWKKTVTVIKGKILTVIRSSQRSQS